MAGRCWARARSSADRRDSEEAPFAGDALECLNSPLFETDAGARDEVLDGAGDEDFACSGERGDPGADVDGDASDLVADDLALPRVKPRASLDAERQNASADRFGAANGPRGTIEGGEETVAGGVHFAATKSDQLAAGERVEAVEQLVPPLVTQSSRPFRRADDVGEEHRGEDTIALDGVPRAR